MKPGTETAAALNNSPAAERLGMICNLLFALAFILFFTLKGYFSLSVIYALAIAIHIVGFSSGFIARRIAPEAVRAELKITRHTMILNGVFAAIFAYRLITL